MRKKILALFTLLFVFASCNQTKNEMKNFDSNFTHVVYFWLKNPNNVEDCASFEKHLSTFLSNSKFAKTNFIGKPPKATRDVVDDSFTYALIVTFSSAEEQESYQTEAAHLKFVEDAQHLWNKVIVYDAQTI